MDEILENIWKTNNSIMDWVKFSDTKATLVLATNGVILSIIFTNFSRFLTLFENSWMFIVLLILLAGVLFSIISIFYSILCLTPQLDAKNNVKVNLLYFKDIATFEDAQKYKKTAENLYANNSELKDHIYDQIFANSNIANTKFERVKCAIRSLGLAIIFLVIPILFFLLKMLYVQIWG